MPLMSAGIPPRTVTERLFHYWQDPDATLLGATCAEFLQRLPGPMHIHITGRDSSRCRIATTLLHGNEPSGLHAVFNTLQQGIQPAVDIHYFIPCVDAARQAPGFIYRMLPHHKDLNRCFKPPFSEDSQEQLALELLQTLLALKPECLIDIHNTSGSSPSFGVTTHMDSRHNALVSLFTHRMIVTDLVLGSLMEISEFIVPAVTIECGGALDPESNRLATEGLTRYLTFDDVLTAEHGELMLEYFQHPIRLELCEGSDIAYGEHCLFEDGVTLLPNVENYNFGFVDATCRLGFVSGELDANLTAKDSQGRERIADFFTLRDGELYPARVLKLFMVTTNPEIARKDCLLYFVEDTEHAQGGGI